MEENKPPKLANRPAGTTEPDVRLLRSITLRNILSFGPDTPELELRTLNVLIGPNGSGKSNLLACLSLLPALATDANEPFRVGNSTIKDWFRNDSFHQTASLKIMIEPLKEDYLVHDLEFGEADYQFRVQRESVRIFADDILFTTENAHSVYLFDVKSTNNARLIAGNKKRYIDASRVSSKSSILAQLRDNKTYPEFARLSEAYEGIVFFRNWSFGSASSIRQPQRADSPSNFLREEGSNLALILNQLRRESAVKIQLLALLNELYEGIDDYETFVQAGYVELFLREGKRLIPASRLSDGTLRFLCLLAILLHPTPPPLICLEEPELGLHPDAVVAVGKLIKEASTRTQLIVTTHSRVLIDTLTDSPEDVIVCGKRDGSTVMERLKSEELANWLKQYGSLGNLWSRGFLGDEAGNGNRW